jgi:hypothetical protein
VTRTAARPASLTSPTSLNSRNHQLPGTFQNRVQITAVTHLTEDGVDRRFIQEQVGHRCDTSTAICTHVSGDFMNTALRKALGPALDSGQAPGRKEP